MRPIHALPLGFTLLLTTLLHPVGAETLKEALALVYNTNPRLSAARASLRATDEEVPQALSGWRPTVRVTSSVGKRRIDTPGAPAADLTPNSNEIQVQQPLYRGGRTVAGTRQAENQVLAGRERLRSTEQDILLEAVTTYMDVVRDEAVADLTQSNERVLRRQLEATEARFEVGALTRTDVAQSKARLSRATTDRVSAERDLIASRATYLRVIGVAPEKLVPPPSPTDLPASEEEALAIAEAESPTLLAARFDEEATRHAVRENTGRLLPTLSLIGAVSRAEEATAGTRPTSTAEIRAQLSVPLYQSGSVWSEARQTRETLTERRLLVNDSGRAVIEAVTQAWEALQTARVRIRSSTDQVLANEVALEGVREEATVGERPILDILDAEQELLDARVSLVRAERDEVVAAFALKQAIGHLSAQRLGLEIEYYDPTAHYKAVRTKWFGFGKTEE